jgi:DNA-binding NtrC family response regulator
LPLPELSSRDAETRVLALLISNEAGMAGRINRDGPHCLSGMRIMIAEDDWLLADTLAVLLEERGARVIGPVPATSSAIRLLDRSEVDFALVDMNLKDCFSDALIERLKARRIPFAILTAYQALPTNAGDSAIVTLHKPVDHRQLFELLIQYSGGPAAA